MVSYLDYIPLDYIPHCRWFESQRVEFDNMSSLEEFKFFSMNGLSLHLLLK